MSFFDEVETTVANTRLLEATEDQVPIKINFTAYEELTAFETKHFAENPLSLKQCLTLATLANYEFARYLSNRGYPLGNFLIDLIKFHDLRTDLTKRLYLFRKILGQTGVIFPNKGNAVDGGKQQQQQQKSKSNNLAKLPGVVNSPDSASQQQNKEIVPPQQEAQGKKTVESEENAPPITKEEAVEEKTPAEETAVEVEPKVVEEQAKEQTEKEEEEEEEAEEEGPAPPPSGPPVARATVTPEANLQQANPKSVDYGIAGFIIDELHREGKREVIRSHCFDKLLLALQESQAVQNHFNDFNNRDNKEYQRLVQSYEYVSRPVTLNEFRIFRVLGRGAFGAVSAAQKLDTRAIYAIKEMKKAMVKKINASNLVLNEMQVLKKMHDSPFVLSLNYSFQDSKSCYLVFEMCSGGDLKYYLRFNREKTAFARERVQFYAAEVLLGLEHLHKYDVLYRDLKPDNIMLGKSGHVLISDLGLAVRYRKDKPIKSVAGTAGYWAPEVVSRRGTVKQSDVWSWGVFVHEMATGSRPQCMCKPNTKEWCPFGLSEVMETNAVLKDGKLCLRLQETMDVKRLDKEMLDLLEKIFEADPRKRLGANGMSEIKQHPFFAGIDWRALARRDVVPPWIPPNSVNAASIGDVGEFDRKAMKAKLTPEDHAVYDKFDFAHAESLQQELREALMKVDDPPPEWLNYSESSGGGCCTIL